MRVEHRIDQSGRIEIEIILANLNLGSLQERQGIFIHPVAVSVHQPGDAGVDQRLGAVDTGEMRHIAG